MEKARMLGMEEAVVGGTEGGRSPTGVPPATAAAAARGPRAAGNGKPIPDPAVAGEARAATVHRGVQASHSPRGRSLHRVRPARRPAAPRGPVLVAPEHLAAATRRRDAGRTDSQASWAEGQPRRPLDRRKRAAQREKPSGWRPSSARPRRSSRSKKNSRRSWGFPCRRPTATGASHEGHRRTCSAGGHGRGLPQPGRAAGDALPASSAEAARARNHATAQAAAGAERAGAATGPRRAPQRAVCRQGPGRGLRGTSWTRGSISARSARCTASWTIGRKSASDATNCDTRPTTSRNWWPPLPIRSGHGTSPSCWGRRNGPTSTST